MQFRHLVVHQGDSDRAALLAVPEHELALGHNVVLASYGGVVLGRIKNGHLPVGTVLAYHVDLHGLLHLANLLRELLEREHARLVVVDDGHLHLGGEHLANAWRFEVHIEVLVELVLVVVDDGHRNGHDLHAGGEGERPFCRLVVIPCVGSAVLRAVVHSCLSVRVPQPHHGELHRAGILHYAVVGAAEREADVVLGSLLLHRLRHVGLRRHSCRH
mmetsp:Transcript_774/g.2507  ORF Transcript_774/g.2507 Transcript_774/m.2507 type:complete len:216 (+) Transcript_774:75-722(+)